VRVTEIELDNDLIRAAIAVDLSSDEILVDRKALGTTDDERLKYNLYTLASKNGNFKKLVVDLCNEGFVIVGHRARVSRFVRFSSAEAMLPFMGGYEYTELLTHERIIYSLEKPPSMVARRMLVVFSSVADPRYASNLAKRNFFKNFSTVGKYIPHDTCVLRLSDLGGVVGSFYLNNNSDSRVEASVQEIIALVARKCAISKEDIVCYGGSKGGVGALYHAVMGGYKAVAVDPVIGEEHYELVHNDCHFTVGTFPVRRFDKFVNLLKTSELNDACSIISSFAVAHPCPDPCPARGGALPAPDRRV